MGRNAQVEFGINAPDYLTNKDIYQSVEKAAAVMERDHIDVDDMAITGLSFDGPDQEGELV